MPFWPILVPEDCCPQAHMARVSMCTSRLALGGGQTVKDSERPEESCTTQVRNRRSRVCPPARWNQMTGDSVPTPQPPIPHGHPLLIGSSGLHWAHPPVPLRVRSAEIARWAVRCCFFAALWAPHMFPSPGASVSFMTVKVCPAPRGD